jgi:hypothetical protein
MKNDLWSGLAVFALVFALQLSLQRNERPATKWLGGGLVALSAALWAFFSVVTPSIRPVGTFVTWLEHLLPIP